MRERIQQQRLHPLQTLAVLVYRRAHQALNERCLRFLCVGLQQRNRARLIRVGDLYQFAQPREAFDRPRERGDRARAFPRGIGHRSPAEGGEGRAHGVEGFLHMREGLADSLTRALGFGLAGGLAGGLAIRCRRNRRFQTAQHFAGARRGVLLAVCEVRDGKPWWRPTVGRNRR